MPFKSKSQMRACWAQKRRSEERGEKSTWDCHKWYHEGGGAKQFAKLPDRKKASRKKSHKKRTTRKKKH